MRLRFADHQRAGGSQLADGEAILPGMETGEGFRTRGRRQIGREETSFTAIGMR